jgi:hypothetical protein
MDNSIVTRIRQAAAVGRHEGRRKLLYELVLFISDSIVSDGDILWVDRDITKPLTNHHEGACAAIAATAEEHARLDAVRPILPEVRKLREGAGGERWYVYIDDPDEFFYTGWTYTSELLVQENPPLSLKLPDGYVQFEDAYVPRDKRYAGQAQIATEAIAAALRERGTHHLISKIDATNAPVVRAAEKDSWRPIARVHGRMWLRRWTTWRVEQIVPVVPQLKELR